MENTKWVVAQLEKRYQFKGYSLNCQEVDGEDTIEYYDVTFGGQPVELKVKYDNKGHWTDFEVEKREGDSEDWYFFDSFEAHIA